MAPARGRESESRPLLMGNSDGAGDALAVDCGAPFEQVSINSRADVAISKYAWQDINCHLTVSSGSVFNRKREEKHILKSVTGHVRGGSLLAIMGPSGSGKTSFLDTLSGRKSVGVLAGTLTLNGVPVSFSDMRGVCGYVSQDDVLLPTLTVRETLMYTMLLRRPRAIQLATGPQAVESVIAQLKLGEVANSKVGNSSIRGVSGGERRRVSIGIELVAQKSILMLDEPTSGLDSSAALMVVRLLKELAKQRNVIVVCTIHQPRSSIFQTFDDLLLLSSGAPMFHGPVASVQDWLAHVSLPCPPHYNVADWLLDIVADDGELGDDVLAGSNSQSRAQKLGQMHAESPLRYLDSQDGRAGSNPLEVQGLIHRSSARPTSWLHQTRVLIRRNIKHMVRHPAIAGQQVAQYIGCAIFCGLLFSKVSRSPFEQKTLAVSFALDVHGVFTFFAIPTYLQDRLIFNRDYNSGAHGVFSYYLAHIIVQLPVCLVIVAYAFLLFKLQHLEGEFWFACLVHTLVFNVYLALNETIGAAFKTVELAIGFAGLLNIYTMVFSGIMALYPNMPVYLRWNWYVTPLGPAASALLDNEFRGTPEGRVYLETVGMPFRGQRWLPIFCLLGFWAVFRVMCYLALRFLQKEKR